MGQLASQAYQQNEQRKVAEQEAALRAQQMAQSQQAMELGRHADARAQAGEGREASAFQGQQAATAEAQRQANHARAVQLMGGVVGHPELWPRTRGEIVTRGWAKPEDVPLEYPGDDAVKGELRGLMTAAQQSEQDAKTADMALKTTQEARALEAAKASTENLAADNRRQDAAAVEAARHNREQERISGLTAGREAASAAETARHNREMEANARNTKIGRPVIAGDAEDIATVDEGLKLARGLNFKQGDTGILPSIGGAMPDAVTNLTGFGVGAKQRQGVINLVKQIIGKGLEGGVLRKEDESKYEKILPTLSDHPDVVQVKVKNLIKILDQKRATRLNAMEDAGYNVSKFRERSAGDAETPPPATPTATHRFNPATGKVEAIAP
jgi:hypothetical protein